LQNEQDITVTRPEWVSSSDLNAQVVGANWVWTPSARWSNELKFGWNRFWQKIVTADSNVPPAGYGINTGVTDPANFGMPTIIIGGFNNPTLGGNRSWPLFTTPNETFQIADNISYTRGKHTFRFGGEFRHGSTDNLRDRSGKTRVRFEGAQAFSTADCNDTTLGQCSTPLEDFLAGFPSRGDLFFGDSRRHVTIKSFGAFVQDDWRIHPRFTAFLGVRYEFNGVIKESRNRLGNFDPAVGLQQVGINIDKPYDNDGNNFAPRVGFSYDVFGTGNTVLRGGFGMTYEIPHLATFLGQNGANNATTPGLNVIPTGAIGSNIAGTIEAAGVNVNPALLNWSAAGPVFGATLGGTLDCTVSACNILGVKKDLKTPYVLSWNINLQHAFGPNSSLQIGYVGQRGNKLYSIRDINQFDPVAGTCPFCATYPFLGVINFLENRYGMSYNGLQTTFTQRAWKGFEFVAGYTWSHAIDQASLNRAQQPQNSNRPDLEWGNSDLDIRHRFTLTSTYNLPERKGSWGQLLEGWQMTSIVTLQTGTPWNVIDGVLNGNDISGTGEFSDRWNFVGNASEFKPATPGSPINYLAGAAAAADPLCSANAQAGQLLAFGCYRVGNSVLVPPDPNTFGTMSRNIFRGPGLRNWDFSVIKNWKYHERLGIQLRAEFFNVLNNRHLASPAASIFFFVDPSDPSTFGCRCATPDVGAANPVIGTGGPRNIQLGLKFRF
ncbi:MAG: hypothetical protein HYX26_01540, partial [Acidobacteriales bacterium]|nr:hypothetical protein [Terriglobales bacterium]